MFIKYIKLTQRELRPISYSVTFFPLIFLPYRITHDRYLKISIAHISETANISLIFYIFSKCCHEKKIKSLFVTKINEYFGLYL